MDVGAKILNEVIMNMDGPLGKEEGEKASTQKTLIQSYMSILKIFRMKYHSYL
jgi:hypothetical protein